MRRSIALISVALVAVACSKNDQAGRVPLGAAPGAPGMQVAQSAPGAPAAGGETLTGTLLEQIAASPYVYVRLKTASGEVWAAVNEAPLTNGAQVTVYNAMLMEKFESKTLKRTFDRVYFGALESPTDGPAPTAMPGAVAMGAAGAPASVGTPPAVDAKVGKVDKAAGANAHTIGELWAGKDALAEKTVSIRGVVVKYNPGVMGKNWIHLQDGSGDAGKGTHDITVTTADAVTNGATVTITGTVRLNKDFGAGYTYAVIVEDAKVVAK